MVKHIESNLLQTASLFALTLRAWSNRRTASLSNIEVDADKNRLHMIKQLIDSPEYDAIRTHQLKTRTWCMERSMPSYIREGMYFVSLDAVAQFEDYLREQSDILQNTLVPALIKAYPTQLAESKKALRSQYNAEDYPSVRRLETMFGIEWNWLTFAVPDKLPTSIRVAEEKKLKKAYKEAEYEVTAALRAGALKLFQHLTDRLDVKGKKAPIFRDSLLEKYQTFIETFNMRNFGNDTELMRVIADARKIVESIPDADTIRNNKKFRRELAGAVSEIKSNVEQLTKAMPSRRMVFDE